MVYENTVSLLGTPVRFPGRADGKRPTKQEVEAWIMKEKPNQFAVTTYGAYGGVAIFLLGLITTAAAIFKRSKVTAWAGGILAGIGVVAAAIFKLFSVEHDLFSKLIDKFVIGPAPVKNQKTGSTVGVSDNVVDINKLHKEPVGISLGENGTLKGCFLPAAKKTNKTIMFLNGRGHHKDDALNEIKKLQGKVNVNLLVVDYRGFGESEFVDKGARTTKSTMVEDSIAMFDYLVKEKKINPEDISVFGASLGGHIATELSTKRKFGTLVIQSSFTAVDDTVKSWLAAKLPTGWADYFASWVVNKEMFDSKTLAGRILADKVIVSHGTNDDWIPFEQGEELYTEIKSVRKGKDVHFIKLLGAKHTDFVDFYLEHDKYAQPLISCCTDQLGEERCINL